ncbi:MAG TPA: hypothetical protein VFS37_12050 [Conexibacter sp.]|nr:hypothetical protein [Conexibacter sp.]
MAASRIASQPRTTGRAAVAQRRCAPVALATALAVVYLIWQPASLDLAAAEYRAWLFDHAGYAIWDAQWYGGHHLPGYSVLFPPLAGWLGPRLLGALAVVAAARLFAWIAFGRFGPDAWLGATWFALGTVSALFSGRITFLLGLVFALGCMLLVLTRGWRAGPVAGEALFAGGAVALALLTALASPVAALFLAVAGVAIWVGARRRVGLAVAVAALAPVAVLAVAFPEGGSEPFVSSAFWPVIGLAAVALVLLPREQQVLRIGVVLYALLAIAVFVVDTPIGGNVVRLGSLCAGPVAALVLWPRRALVLACVAPLLLWWQLGPAILDVTTAEGDPSVQAAYYAPLLAELRTRGGDGTTGRLEIPFTKVHWEARHVAPAIPLARGWERQLDRKVNALFYDDAPLTPARYRAWLDRMAVRWVAVPDVALDYSARAEADLVARGLPYLREVWRDERWRLYEVVRSAPLAAPPARVLATATDALSVSAPRAGTVRLRVRWSPYWTVARGDACVAPDGDWTRLQLRQAGTVHLTMDFSPLRIGSHAARCGVRTVVNGG